MQLWAAAQPPLHTLAPARGEHGGVSHGCLLQFLFTLQVFIVFVINQECQVLHGGHCLVLVPRWMAWRCRLAARTVDAALRVPVTTTAFSGGGVVQVAAVWMQCSMLSVYGSSRLGFGNGTSMKFVRKCCGRCG